MIELRLLRCFCAVAEVEHVGRAAAALHVSQSPLSRQLRQLESSLGILLFHRERQRIRLTAEGRWFFGESRRLLADAERLEREATRVGRGEAGSVRAGFVKTAMWTHLLPRALRQFRAKRPDAAIELRGASSSDQIAGILRGELDVGLVHNAPKGEGLKSVLLSREPLFLALPRDHALTDAARISPAHLDGTEWVVLSPRGDSKGRDVFVAACARAGFTPVIRFHAGDQTTALGLVDAGMGLALLPESAAAEGKSGVVLRRLPWLPISRALYAVYRGDGAPLAHELVACLKACAVDAPKRAQSSTK